jgi:HemK-related putative methylase
MTDTQLDAGGAGAGALATGRDAASDVERAVSRLDFRWVRSTLGRLAFRYNARQIRRRYNSFVLERVHDVPIIVTPDVFNPVLMRTGAFFAAELSAERIPAQATVLDLGTGSGVCAVFAARHARHVVAVDINPAAVRCAGANVLINGLESKVEVRQGDLFGPVGADRFDIVLFNPPFVRGVPASAIDRAWRSDILARRFADGLPDRLQPSGYALVMLSTFGDPAMFIDEFRRRAFTMSVLAQRRFVNERLTILKIQCPRDGAPAAVSRAAGAWSDR